MPSAFSAFLARNSVIESDTLPVIHSTRSYNFRAILSGQQISAQPCDVFEGENLNYFFVGRPAYKYESDNSTAEPWELPCCFIFNVEDIGPIKRVFPFDSGALAGGRYPSYLNGMPMDEFECNTSDAIGKTIGAFFGSPTRYFNLNPKPRAEFEHEYSLTPLDAELEGAMRLAGEATPSSFDDRRFTIEVQSESSIDLGDVHPLAVVLPEVYLDVEGVLERIQDDWGAEPIGYPIYPLNLSAYYAVIYREVHTFLKREGYL